jgi:hypothetical protein
LEAVCALVYEVSGMVTDKKYIVGIRPWPVLGLHVGEPLEWLLQGVPTTRAVDPKEYVLLPDWHYDGRPVYMRTTRKE